MIRATYNTDRGAVGEPNEGEGADAALPPFLKDVYLEDKARIWP